jgi:DNA-binding transcriptional regulator LsrR (DeoR family)
MINKQLKQARKFEDMRYISESRMIGYMHMRNIWILASFNSRLRQKEIANVLGLSESRVKKIIAEMRTK